MKRHSLNAIRKLLPHLTGRRWTGDEASAMKALGFQEYYNSMSLMIGECGAITIRRASGMFIYHRRGTDVRGGVPKDIDALKAVIELCREHAINLDNEASRRLRCENFVNINAVEKIKSKLIDMGMADYSAKVEGQVFCLYKDLPFLSDPSRTFQEVFYKYKVRKSKFAEDTQLLIENLEHIVKVYELPIGRFT